MDAMTIILTLLAGCVLLIFFYRYYSAKFMLENLTSRPKRKKFASKHKKRYMDGNIPIDNTNFGSSDVIGYDSHNTDASHFDGGGGEFGGAGATGGWEDGGAGSDK